LFLVTSTWKKPITTSGFNFLINIYININVSVRRHILWSNERSKRRDRSKPRYLVVFLSYRFTSSVELAGYCCHLVALCLQVDTSFLKMVAFRYFDFYVFYTHAHALFTVLLVSVQLIRGENDRGRYLESSLSVFFFFLLRLFMTLMLQNTKNINNTFKTQK